MTTQCRSLRNWIRFWRKTDNKAAVFLLIRGPRLWYDGLGYLLTMLDIKNQLFDGLSVQGKTYSNGSLLPIVTDTHQVVVEVNQQDVYILKEDGSQEIIKHAFVSVYKFRRGNLQ